MPTASHLTCVLRTWASTSKVPYRASCPGRSTPYLATTNRTPESAVASLSFNLTSDACLSAYSRTHVSTPRTRHSDHIPNVSFVAIVSPDQRTDKARVELRASPAVRRGRRLPLTTRPPVPLSPSAPGYVCLPTHPPSISSAVVLSSPPRNSPKCSLSIGSAML
jgi:hypothetical protein